MKVFKRIFIWVMISLVLQISVLIYLNNFYFSSAGPVKGTKVSSTMPTVKKPIAIKIDNSNEQVKLSYNGKYLSYLDNGALKVVDTETGKISDISITQGSSLSYYKWLSDRNRMIIVEKTINSNGATIKFYNYDMSNNQKEEVRDNIHNKSITITVYDQKAEVTDLSISTITNLIYAKVSLSSSKSVIYSMDIMAEMNKTQTIGYVLGSIAAAPTKDILFYEDLSNRRVRTTYWKSIIIKGVNNPCLLGVDGDNNVYIGSLIDDKVTKIYWGNIEDDINTWKSVDVSEPTEKKYVNVTDKGIIYIDNNLNGSVKDLVSGKETSYKGTFLQMYTSGVASISEGELVKTEFK